MIQKIREFLQKMSNSETQTEAPYLIVGLGNHGREYRNNRHNVGFMIVDRMVERLGVQFSRMQSRALVTKATLDGKRVIFAKPQTYMNLSGQAVAGLVNFYKILPENILIVFDEMDLPMGTLRLRPGGGSSGHNGMRSVIKSLGSQDFPRLRVGIDHPPGRMDPKAYLLSDFSNSQAETLSELLDVAEEAVLTFIRDGIEQAMNQFNGEHTTI